MLIRRSLTLLLALACAPAAPRLVLGQEEAAKEDAKRPAVAKPAAEPAPADLEVPAPDKPPVLLPTLHTIPTKHGGPAFNLHMVDASVLPRDRQTIWVLNFAFKPMRMVTVDIPGKGRRTVYYLYYKVVNRTGKPVQFVPQFTLVTDTGQRHDDVVIPQAVKKVQAREDPTIPLVGAVNIMGVLPPSKKEGVDDAVYGVAVWDRVDPKSDAIHIYVRGLSDGYQTVASPDGGKPLVRYKTLRIDFTRHGDEHNIHEKEIHLNDPPYEWVYW